MRFRVVRGRGGGEEEEEGRRGLTFPVGESVACAKGGETVGRRRGRSHYDAEEPIFWAAWRDATRYAAMLRDYHNNRRYYSVAGFAAGVERRAGELRRLPVETDFNRSAGCASDALLMGIPDHPARWMGRESFVIPISSPPPIDPPRSQPVSLLLPFLPPKALYSVSFHSFTSKLLLFVTISSVILQTTHIDHIIDSFRPFLHYRAYIVSSRPS